MSSSFLIKQFRSYQCPQVLPAIFDGPTLFLSKFTIFNSEEPSLFYGGDNVLVSIEPARDPVMRSKRQNGEEYLPAMVLPDIILDKVATRTKRNKINGKV